MSKVKRVSVVLFFTLVFLGTAMGQQPRPTPEPAASPTSVQIMPAPTLTEAPTLNEILDRAQIQSVNYREAFKNLLADETKSFEVYDKRGEIKRRRSVVSNFIVYPLSKSTGRIAEYRNVLSVDGKTISNTESRAQDFFERIAKSESSGKELDELERESLRYDEDLSINGLTLFQALALQPNLRPNFTFTLEGRQTFEGTDVYVISFNQSKSTPDITINSNSPKPDDRITVGYEVDIDRKSVLNERMRGRFFIDAATYRLWREEREYTIQPEGFTAPLVVVREDFNYQRGDLDILVPKKIIHTHFRVKSKEMSAAKDVQVSFDYTKFTKPDVEVKSADVKG